MAEILQQLMNNYWAAAREPTVRAKMGGARLRNGDLEHKLLLQK